MRLGLFHYLQLRQLSRQSFAVIITKIAKCLKVRIPIKQSLNCQTKLEKVFKECYICKKTSIGQTNSPTQLDIVSKFDNLFDIVDTYALTGMSVLQEIWIPACSVNEREYQCLEYIKS